MAPEIIDNKEYTLKADIYSYGVYLYLLLDNNMGNLCKKNPLQWHESTTNIIFCINKERKTGSKPFTSKYTKTSKRRLNLVNKTDGVMLGRGSWQKT